MNGEIRMEKWNAQFVFLLEESSAKHLLETILPKILPKDSWHCIPYNGKSDLQKSIPITIRAWRNPRAKFIILHDQDINDCKKLKESLKELCKNARRPDTLVRIVCRELEAWYWGDLDAVQKAYPRFKAESVRNRAQYRQPDKIHSPAHKLENYIPEFQKGAAARKIPRYMSISKNISPSFKCFISGVKNL